MKLSMWYISNLGCYSLTSQASNYNMHSDSNWPQGYGTGSFRLDSDLIFLKGLEKTSRKFLREMLVGLIRWGEKGKNGGWWKVGGEGEYVECRESLKEAGHIWNRGKVTHILVGSWHLYIPGKDLEKKVTQGDGKFSNFFLETVYHLVVVQPLSHVRLCDPMDCSPPGFPVLHHLPELSQTHIHWVGDAIQPSCPLSSPSPPAFNLSQHQGLLPSWKLGNST